MKYICLCTVLAVVACVVASACYEVKVGQSGQAEDTSTPITTNVESNVNTFLVPVHHTLRSAEKYVLVESGLASSSNVYILVTDQPNTKSKILVANVDPHRCKVTSMRVELVFQGETVLDLSELGDWVQGNGITTFPVELNFPLSVSESGDAKATRNGEVVKGKVRISRLVSVYK